MNLINRDNIKYTDLILNPKTGTSIKVVAKVSIDSMPTIDNDLIEHGQWELADDGDGVVCSCCGTDFCIMIYHTEDFKFCPNCGAKMEYRTIGIDLANGDDFSACI